ncbi:hypothetical protein AB0A74_18305 [Saccharothrix sp. NPDC042600]|uniref:hypothetical protein n=1 Tax=Saccharothrix TaxID=2071 RepID=UPI0033D799BB
MRRADFDAVLLEFESIIHDNGFTGSKGVYRLPNGVQCTFMLDKFGWDPELGWGFLLDVQDVTRKDKSRHVPDEFHIQVGPHDLVRTLGRDAIVGLYADNDVMGNRAAGSWFLFDHAERLRSVLRLMLRPALTHVRTWAESVHAPTWSGGVVR